MKKINYFMLFVLFCSFGFEGLLGMRPRKRPRLNPPGEVMVVLPPAAIVDVPMLEEVAASAASAAPASAEADEAEVLLIYPVTIRVADEDGMRHEHNIPCDVWCEIFGGLKNFEPLLLASLHSDLEKTCLYYFKNRSMSTHPRLVHVNAAMHRIVTRDCSNDDAEMMTGFEGRQAFTKFDHALAFIVAYCRHDVAFHFEAGGNEHLKRMATVLNSKYYGDQRGLVTEIVLDRGIAGRFTRRGVQTHVYKNFSNLSSIAFIGFNRGIVLELLEGLQQLKKLSSVVVRGESLLVMNLQGIVALSHLKSIVVDRIWHWSNIDLETLHRNSGETLECFDVPVGNFRLPFASRNKINLFSNLKKVRLQGPGLTDEYLQQLPHQLSHLRFLILENCDNSILGVGLVALGAQLHTLEVCNKDATVSDGIIVYLCTKLPALRELHVAQSNLRVEYIFQSFPGLRYFKVGRQRFEREDVVPQPLRRVAEDGMMVDLDDE